jgi:arylsulfatase A-like enzyme
MLGAGHVFDEDGAIGVGSRPALAEQLRTAGVSTGGFNAANGFLTPHWGYDRGFDRFESCLEGGRLLGSRYVAAHPTVQAWLQFLSTPARRVSARLRGTEVSPVENTAKLHDVERGARDFLADADTPFFCWVHYMDLHTPYVPAPRHVRAVSGDRTGLVRLLRSHVNAGLGRGVTEGALDSLRTLYRAALRGVDESIARLLDALDERGLRESTCVVLAGDHGEEFQEHGHLAHYPKLYEELIHVPLVVDAPGVSGRVPEPVGLDSIPPTVGDALGVGVESVGESLWPALHGEPPTQEPVLSATVRGESVTDQPIPRARSEGELLVSARTDRYTYIHHTESERRELYDRRTDPGEQVNLLAETRGGDAGEHGATVARLHDAVTAYRDRMGTEVGDTGEAEAAVERRLAALGYR